MPRITVFCGSRMGSRPAYREAAEALGQSLARRGFGLVYGGSSIGLMNVIAEASLRSGGEVIGVIPRRMVDREIAHRGLSELFVVDSMHERKAKMAELSDAFIAMPGGLGTFDELFEITTWALLGLHAKPIGLLDVEAYFEPLSKMVEHGVQEGFVDPAHASLIMRAGDAETLLQTLFPL